MNPVHYRVRGTVTLTLPVEIDLRILAAGGAAPTQAIRNFCKTGVRDHSDGLIDDAEYRVAGRPDRRTDPILDALLAATADGDDEDAVMTALAEAIAALHADGEVIIRAVERYTFDPTNSGAAGDDDEPED
jgi:transglutaminase-like putative cysteine protease